LARTRLQSFHKREGVGKEVLGTEGFAQRRFLERKVFGEEGFERVRLQPYRKSFSMNCGFSRRGRRKMHPRLALNH
jgi:hypothetical protein